MTATAIRPIRSWVVFSVLICKTNYRLFLPSRGIFLEPKKARFSICYADRHPVALIAPAMERFTISLDEKLAEEFDGWIAARGYSNRSEAVRDLLRAELGRTSIASEKSKHCVASLSYVFNHHERDLTERLATIQHEHHDLDGVGDARAPGSRPLPRDGDPQGGRRSPCRRCRTRSARNAASITASSTSSASNCTRHTITARRASVRPAGRRRTRPTWRRTFTSSRRTDRPVRGDRRSGPLAGCAFSSRSACPPGRAGSRRIFFAPLHPVRHRPRITGLGRSKTIFL